MAVDVKLAENVLLSAETLVETTRKLMVKFKSVVETFPEPDHSSVS